MNVGDIVNVEMDVKGIDAHGKTYTLSKGGWFYNNVVQILDFDSSTVTVDDGTFASPIVIIYPPDGLFSQANFMNRLLFKPYSSTLKIGNNLFDSASRLTGSFSDNITMVFWGLCVLLVTAVIVPTVVRAFRKK